MTFVQTVLELLSAWWGDVEKPLIVAVGVFVFLVWLSRNVLARAAISLTGVAAARFQLEIDDKLRKQVQPAFAGLVFAVAVYVAIWMLQLPGVAARILESLAQVFVIFSVFWLVNSFVQSAIRQASKFGVQSSIIQGTWFPKFVRLILIILMIVVMLKGWGIDLGPALTGLGIAGAAVAFAAQDLIKNLIAGLNVAGERRFREGDWIRTGGGIEGIVDSMDLRSTMVRTFDRALVHVPNSELANEPLINYTQRSERRIFWQIPVRFDAPSDKLDAICSAISDHIATNKSFAHKPRANHYVYMYAFDESYIRVIIDCFLATNNWESELKERHALVIEIKKIFAEHDTEFALPAQRIVTEKANWSV